MSKETKRIEEWHATVTGNVVDWIAHCNDHGWTPLFLELNNGSVQLMCTAASDPRPVLDDYPEFGVLRIKHEVLNLEGDEKPLYYEVHAKFDGQYRPDHRGASRDLLRSTASPNGARGRWYITYRANVPIDVPSFAELMKGRGKGSTLVDIEQEVVLLDTNTQLDANWL